MECSNPHKLNVGDWVLLRYVPEHKSDIPMKLSGKWFEISMVTKHNTPKIHARLVRIIRPEHVVAIVRKNKFATSVAFHRK
jgi:hypothetical protein